MKTDAYKEDKGENGDTKSQRTILCNWVEYFKSWELNNNKHFWWSVRFAWIKLLSISSCRQATLVPYQPTGLPCGPSLGNICWAVTWFVLKSLVRSCTYEALQAASQASLPLQVWINCGRGMWEISPSASISTASLGVPLHTHMMRCVIWLHDHTSLSPHTSES